MPDWILRQVPKANKWLKDRAYDSVLKWLKEQLQEAPEFITATTADDDDMERVNLLSTLASNRPDVGASAGIHKEVTLILVKAFYADGVINMRVGKNRSTAFLDACGQGNFEIAEVLLERGAGFSSLG